MREKYFTILKRNELAMGNAEPASCCPGCCTKIRGGGGGCAIGAHPGVGAHAVGACLGGGARAACTRGGSVCTTNV